MISESKIQATFRLNQFKQKSYRSRHKRKLIDLPISESTGLENLLSSIRGAEGWAKLTPGSLKIVKRLTP